MPAKPRRQHQFQAQFHWDHASAATCSRRGTGGNPPIAAESSAQSGLAQGNTVHLQSHQRAACGAGHPNASGTTAGIREKCPRDHCRMAQAASWKNLSISSAGGHESTVPGLCTNRHCPLVKKSPSLATHQTLIPHERVSCALRCPSMVASVHAAGWVWIELAHALALEGHAEIQTGDPGIAQTMWKACGERASGNFATELLLQEMCGFLWGHVVFGKHTVLQRVVSRWGTDEIQTVPTEGSARWPRWKSWDAGAFVDAAYERASH